MNDIANVINEFETDIKATGQKPSTRFLAGLLGVSHETLWKWKKERRPSLVVLQESKARIVAAYRAVDKLIEAITKDSTPDLVVAEADK